MDRGEYVDARTERIKEELFALVASLSLAIATIPYRTDDKGRMVMDAVALGTFQSAFREWARKTHIRFLPSFGSMMQDIHDIVLGAYKERGFSPKISSKLLNMINTLGFTKNPGEKSYGAFVAKAEDVLMRLQGWITRSMIGGKPHSQFLGEIKELVPSEFDRYYKTHLYDMGMQYERVTNNSYGEQLGLTHAVYAGGIIDTTRHFCDDRNGKVWTLAEIRSWNDLSWRGKIEGVDVLMALGGYNCRHYLNYISEETYNYMKENE